jgi:hypothetical protein
VDAGVIIARLGWDPRRGMHVRTSGGELILFGGSERLDEKIAMEVKAKHTVSAADLSGLKSLREEKKSLRFVLVYLGKQQLDIDGIEVLPYEKFLDEIWMSRDTETE